MDLREIHALHAQYAEQPIVIDMERHVNAMPALPAPNGNRSTSSSARSSERLIRYGRVSLICIACAVTAAGTGIGAARLWTSSHRPRNAEVVEGKKATPRPAVAASHSAPPPLSASALPVASPAVQSPLADVDSHALLAAHPGPDTRPGHHMASDVVAPATASPIFQKHTAAPSTKPRKPVGGASRQPAELPASAAAPVVAPHSPTVNLDREPSLEHHTAAHAAPSVAPSIKPVVAHPEAERQPRHAGLAATPEHQANAVQSATPATTAHAGRSGDVTLF